MADIGGRDSKKRKNLTEIEKREKLLKTIYRKLISTNKSDPDNHINQFVLKEYDKEYTREKLEKQERIDAFQKIITHLDNLMEDKDISNDNKKHINKDLVNALNKINDIKKRVIIYYTIIF